MGSSVKPEQKWAIAQANVSAVKCWLHSLRGSVSSAVAMLTFFADGGPWPGPWGDAIGTTWRWRGGLLRSHDAFTQPARVKGILPLGSLPISSQLLGIQRTRGRESKFRKGSPVPVYP